MDWQNFRLQQRLNFPNHIIEEVYSTIAEIDGVKNSWQIIRNYTKENYKWENFRKEMIDFIEEKIK